MKESNGNLTKEQPSRIEENEQNRSSAHLKNTKSKESQNKSSAGGHNLTHEDHIHEDSCSCGHDHSHEDHIHEDSCSCHDHSHDGHMHEDSCSCHDHSHDGHMHKDSCSCGHDHSHEDHIHEDFCSCGHDHSHEDHMHESNQFASPLKSAASAPKLVYTLENLGCAHCASQMESKIQSLPEVEDAILTYTTKQLQVYTRSSEDLLPKIQAICSSIESEVLVTARTARGKKMDEVPAKGKGFTENQLSLITLLSGITLFIAAKVCETYASDAVLPLYAISYLVLGGRVLLTAAKNITKGHVFDENFLMSIATIGAFVIQLYSEAAGVMLFYRIGEYFEDVAVRKSRNQIMDAVDLRPEVVNLAVGDAIKTIPAKEAAIGDILVVRPGDRIPLDGRLVDGESRIDTSPVTGEPVPVKVTSGDSVLSGCMNTSGLIRIRVEKTLEESMVTRILDSVENAAANKPQIDRFITRFSRVYTPFVVAAAVVTAIIPSLITGNWSHWIYTALTFLVISCPCALVLSVPLSFFSGIGAGSKKGILFKGGASLEAMKQVKVVVMDKTGTITKGNFAVSDLLPAKAIDSDALLAYAAGCEANSTHPIGTSIVKAAKECGLSYAVPTEVEEISGKGLQAKFAEDTILCGSQALLNQFHVDTKEYQPTTYGTEVLLAKNGLYIGCLLISDTLKEDAKSAIAAIRSQGIRTVMLTGDAQASADSVALATGIDEVHAKLLPEQKLELLNQIRHKYGPVMFVGDGINDAPVLAGADVGAAMGSGADAAIEAADVVFMNSNMTAIADSIAIARKTNQISWQNVIFALGIKACVMLLGLIGFASMWFAVFADSGVAMLCVLNSIRILYQRRQTLTTSNSKSMAPTAV